MVLPFHSPWRRAGLSVTEVLMAIFVMGLGMISLLVLFPVGMANVRWAVQDNALSRATQQALALAEAPRFGPTMGGTSYSLRTDPTYNPAMPFRDPNNTNPLTNVVNPLKFTDGVNISPYVDPTDPDQWAFNTQQGGGLPVFVDPIGTTVWPYAPVVGTGNKLGYYVGYNIFQPTIPCPAGQSLGVPRVNSAYAATAEVQSVWTTVPVSASPRDKAIRLCAVEDDLTFDTNGLPRTSGTGLSTTIERERRYSWAYMCRWPQANDPSVVEMDIVLFNGRPLSNAGPIGSSPPGELRYAGVTAPLPGFNNTMREVGRVFARGSSKMIVQIPTNGMVMGNPLHPSFNRPVAVPRGSWVVDNTIILPEFLNYAAIPGVCAAGRTYAPFLPQIQDVQLFHPVTRELLGTVKSGLGNGYFYKVISVGDPEPSPAGGLMQVIELDRPARADGYEAVFMPQVVNVIEKSSGRRPNG